MGCTPVLEATQRFTQLCAGEARPSRTRNVAPVERESSLSDDCLGTDFARDTGGVGLDSIFVRSRRQRYDRVRLCFQGSPCVLHKSSIPRLFATSASACHGRKYTSNMSSTMTASTGSCSDLSLAARAATTNGTGARDFRRVKWVV